MYIPQYIGYIPQYIGYIPQYIGVQQLLSKVKSVSGPQTFNTN